MSELVVGQWLRCTYPDAPCVAKFVSIDPPHVRMMETDGLNIWVMLEFVEIWTPRPGERVRVAKSGNPQLVGTVVTYGVRKDDGHHRTLDDADGLHWVFASETEFEPAFDEPEVQQVTVGGGIESLVGKSLIGRDNGGWNGQVYGRDENGRLGWFYPKPARDTRSQEIVAIDMKTGHGLTREPSQRPVELSLVSFNGIKFPPPVRIGRPVPVATPDYTHGAEISRAERQRRKHRQAVEMLGGEWKGKS